MALAPKKHELRNRFTESLWTLVNNGTIIMVIGCTTECFKVYSCLPKGPPDCIPQGESKAFLILEILPLTRQVVREGDWLTHWTGWCCSMCLCHGTRFWSKWKFQVKKFTHWKRSKEGKKTKTKKNQLRRNMKNLSRKGEKRNEHLQLGENFDWGRPELEEPAVLGQDMGCRRTWETHGARQQARRVIKITRKQR